jgi:hypothetical protein
MARRPTDRRRAAVRNGSASRFSIEGRLGARPVDPDDADRRKTELVENHVHGIAAVDDDEKAGYDGCCEGRPGRKGNQVAMRWHAFCLAEIMNLQRRHECKSALGITREKSPSAASVVRRMARSDRRTWVSRRGGRGFPGR